MSRIRLEDREKRTGRSFFRKKVFLERTDTDRYVSIEFHENYKKIYENYIRAFSLLPADYVGVLHAAYTEELRLKVEYLGEPLPNTIANRNNIFKTLRKIHSVNTHNGAYQAPRYFSDVNRTISGQYVQFSMLNEMLDADPIHTSLGYGIEDPAVSNFVKNDKDIHLVDFDNFDVDYSLDSMLGFMLADSVAEDLSTVSVADLLEEALAVYPRLNCGLFMCGAAGRISVVIIDGAIEGAKSVAYAEEIVEELAGKAIDLLYK